MYTIKTTSSLNFHELNPIGFLIAYMVRIIAYLLFKKSFNYSYNTMPF